MTDRERLIELINQAKDKTPCSYNPDIDCEAIVCSACENGSIADYLLANGVIVPPCKVGDTVYVDSDTWGFAFLYFDSKFIYSKHFLVGEVVSIIKTKKQLLMKIRVSNSIHTRYKHRRYTVNAIGKTVFLTKEEAEQALKEREGE